MCSHTSTNVSKSTCPFCEISMEAVPSVLGTVSRLNESLSLFSTVRFLHLERLSAELRINDRQVSEMYPSMRMSERSTLLADDERTAAHRTTLHSQDMRGVHHVCRKFRRKTHDLHTRMIVSALKRHITSSHSRPCRLSGQRHQRPRVIRPDRVRAGKKDGHAREGREIKVEREREGVRVS